MYSIFSQSRPLEYPDWVESADSDVADITELEKPDRPEAGLENRPGSWPLHLSSSQEQVDSELALLLAAEQEVLQLTTREPESKVVHVYMLVTHTQLFYHTTCTLILLYWYIEDTYQCVLLTVSVSVVRL